MSGNFLDNPRWAKVKEQMEKNKKKKKQDTQEQPSYFQQLKSYVSGSKKKGE